MTRADRKDKTSGSDDSGQVRLVRSPQAARWTLLVLTVISLALLALIVEPFAAALFIAAVIAGAINPWYERLAARIKGRRQVAAGLTTAAILLIVVLPLASIGVVLANDVAAGATYVRTTLRSEGVQGLANDLPRPLRALAEKLMARLPQDQGDLQDLTQKQSGRAAAAVGGVLRTTWGVVIQLVMMLIAFFFFLVDGPQLLDWVSHAAPLRPEQTRELLGEFRKVSAAVLFSSVANAAIQAAAALLGFLMAGIPQPFFFAFVTFIFAFVPAVGAWSVVVLTGLLAFLRGDPRTAIFLAVWGAVVVGLADHWVKPLLMRGRIEIHGALIFFALLGGLANFGAVGLLAGPLIVAFFLAVVRMCQREFGEPAS